MTRLVITGAGGFLGKALVAAAQDASADVVPLGRADADLADGTGLAEILAGADAVIHAAAGSGGDDSHARDTLQATEHLLKAMPDGARLVLVSSFSVYAFDGMPDWALLDEMSPTDPDGGARDAYARAKIAQEKLAIHAAQTAGLDLWIARPGAIFGAGRTTTARLGWQKAGRWICPGGDAPVPAIHVDDCARALVRAALVADGGWPEDMPILTGAGHVRIVNLVSPEPPRQSDWLAAIGAEKQIKLPRKHLMRAATALELLGDVVPSFGRRVPNGLSAQTLAARFKPLHYASHRAQDRLGYAPAQSFAEAMAASREASSS